MLNETKEHNNAKQSSTSVFSMGRFYELYAYTLPVGPFCSSQVCSMPHAGMLVVSLSKYLFWLIKTMRVFFLEA